jgi:Rod binding domain-containing protein
MRPPKKATKAKPKKPAKDTRPQRERFEEAAKEAGVDESGEAFERAVAQIIPKRRTSSSRQSDQTKREPRE